MYDRKRDTDDGVEDIGKAAGWDSRADENARLEWRAKEIHDANIPKPTTQQELARQERSHEHSRALGNDAARAARELEDKEIETNPHGWMRRHLDEGWDEATKYRLKESLTAHGWRPRD